MVVPQIGNNLIGQLKCISVLYSESLWYCNRTYEKFFSRNNLNKKTNFRKKISLKCQTNIDKGIDLPLHIMAAR